MTDWTICIAVWGEAYRRKFTHLTLPAIFRALDRRASGSARFVIYTDAALALRPHFSREYPAEFRPVTATYDNKYLTISQASRQVLQQARVGEAVAFINADMVPSVEVFAAAEKRFQAGKQLIMCMGTRAYDSVYPSPGMASRDLLSWGWEHRHHWTSDCTWGTGRSAIPSVIYCPVADGVVLHAFHLHPFAVLKTDAQLSFQGTTVDRDLLDYFSRDKIHVVTDADEMAFAELSRASYLSGARIRRVIDPVFVAEFARDCVTPAHRWLFGHRIEIVGPATDHSDEHVAGEILGAIDALVPKPDWSEKARQYWSSRERIEFIESQINPLANILEQVR